VPGGLPKISSALSKSKINNLPHKGLVIELLLHNLYQLPTTNGTNRINNHCQSWAVQRKRMVAAKRERPMMER